MLNRSLAWQCFADKTALFSLTNDAASEQSERALIKNFDCLSEWLDASRAFDFAFGRVRVPSPCSKY